MEQLLGFFLVCRKRDIIGFLNLKAKGKSHQFCLMCIYSSGLCISTLPRLFSATA